jgi:hypothetical protein
VAWPLELVPDERNFLELSFANEVDVNHIVESTGRLLQAELLLRIWGRYRPDSAALRARTKNERQGLLKPSPKL